MVVVRGGSVLFGEEARNSLEGTDRGTVAVGSGEIWNNLQGT